MKRYLDQVIRTYIIGNPVPSKNWYYCDIVNRKKENKLEAWIYRKDNEQKKLFLTMNKKQTDNTSKEATYDDKNEVDSFVFVVEEALEYAGYLVAYDFYDDEEEAKEDNKSDYEYEKADSSSDDKSEERDYLAEYFNPFY